MKQGKRRCALSHLTQVLRCIGDLRLKCEQFEMV
jgi:hypothetical protein